VASGGYLERISDGEMQIKTDFAYSCTLSQAAVLHCNEVTRTAFTNKSLQIIFANIQFRIFVFPSI
jgi:hypothetical protein